jgi:hypothetical protein
MEGIMIRVFLPAIALFVGCATAWSQQAADSLPPGWERPTETDLAGPDLIFRKERPDRYLRAEGDFDFDGDGSKDRAELLINRANRVFALFVFTRASKDPIRLAEAKLSEFEPIGISVSPPGRMKTACGKGYFGGEYCRKHPSYIDPQFDSISYFMFESASTQFYWDGRTFQEEAISD